MDLGALTTELRKIPPVTRFLCASSLAMTLPVILNIASPYKLLYVQQLTFNKLQFWRLYTSFFYGGGGLVYVFDFIMLYRNSDQLENGPYVRKSADYAWQLFFACAAIIATNTPLSSYTFCRPLLLCLIYLNSKLAPAGAQTSIMGLVTIPVSYTPYMMIALDLLISGPRAAAQAAGGAVVGHLWWWGVWGAAYGARGGVLDAYGRAPEWLKRFMGQDSTPPTAGGGMAGGGVTGGVHIIPPRRQVPTRNAGSSTTTATRTSGYRWGTGHRLGDS